MSAIMETEPGGEMVCILRFSARPRGLDDQPIPGERRSFQVGERVRYVNFFYKKTPEDNPTGYMAVFEPLDPEDKNRYAASDTYFVTLDCWEDLGRYFARTNAKGIKRRSVADQPDKGARDPIAAKAKKPARAAAKISSTARIPAQPQPPQPGRKLSRGKGVRKVV
jgi:hypothetical protein